MSASIRSVISFDQPYGLIGLCGVVSRTGDSSGMPYVAAVELKMKCGTPAVTAASISARLRTVLLR